MAKFSILAGTTSKTVKIFIQNNSVTTGAGLTGLAFGTSGLTAYYIREGAASTVQITLATQTLGTWATGGFIVVDGTNMPGLYELGIPNLALAAGAKSVVIYLQGATNMAQTLLEIELTAIDNQSTGFGLVNASANVVQINSVSTSSVTTVNANQGTTQPLNFTGTAGSALVKSDMVDVAGAAVSATTAQIGTNVVNINNVAAATPGASGGILISGSNNGTTTLGALTVTGATTMTGGLTAAITGNITGNLSGSVGSVTGNIGGNVTGSVGSVVGAVGSVTGNVGGNVTGSVGSVVGAVGSVTAAVATTSNIKKNSASAGFTFPMTDATTHTLKTGLTVAGTVSLDGASFVSLTNAISEIGTTGIYKVDLAAADVNGNHAMLKFTATGADDRPIEIITQP